jgi:hypothetical protein
MCIPDAIKKRFTLGVCVVLLNYVVWRVGAFLDRFGGELDMFGAQLCRTTYHFRWYLIAGACVYSFVRRFVLRRQQWDFYGPALGALIAELMWIERESNVRY